MATINPYKGINTIAPPTINTIGDYNNQVQQLQQEQVEAQPTVETIPEQRRIANITNSEADFINENGYSDAQINKYHQKEYNPETDGANYLAHLWETNKKKPRELTPEQENKARITSNIGEALGTLGEMYSAGQGAHIKPRDFSNSSTAQTEKKINDVRNLYLAQQDQYDNGMLNAKMQDYQTGKHDFNTNKQAITTAIREKKAFDAAAAKRAEELAMWRAEFGFKQGTELFNQNYKTAELTNKKTEFGITSGQKDKEIEQKDKQFGVTMGLEGKKLNETARNNRAANKASQLNADAHWYDVTHKVQNSYSWSSEYGGKDGKTPMSKITIPANKKDPSKRLNETGVYVTDLKVESGMVPYYSNQGKLALANDPVFQMKFKAAIDKASESGNDGLAQLLSGSTKKQSREGDETIAAFFAQYQYENQYTNNQPQARPAYQKYLPGGAESAVGNNTVPTKGKVR